MQQTEQAVTPKWPRIPYDEAIRKYGTDKPDLRNPIEMADVTEHFRGSGFKIFAGMIEKDPKVARVGDPGAERRLARLLRPHERAGRRARASRASATSSGADGPRGQGRFGRQDPRSPVEEADLSPRTSVANAESHARPARS